MKSHHLSYSYYICKQAKAFSHKLPWLGAEEILVIFKSTQTQRVRLRVCDDTQLRQLWAVSKNYFSEGPCLSNIV